MNGAVSVATPTNAFSYLFQSQHVQSQRLDYLQHEMAEMKQMLQMALGGQRTSAPMAEPQAGTFEAMAPASTLDMTRDAVPNREDIDQAKRKIMEQARAQTRMTAAKTTFEPMHYAPSSVSRHTWAVQEDFAQASDREREEQLQDVKGKLTALLEPTQPAGNSLGHAYTMGMGEGYDSQLRMPNPHQSIEFAVAMDARNDYAADPFLGGGADYNAEQVPGESEGLRNAGNPDPFMSMEFHPQRPEMGGDYRPEGVFTPGGTNVADEPELMGLPGQDPMLAPRTFGAPTASNTFSSFIKKDWNMDDKYIPVNANDKMKWDNPHHESISGHPIPVLPVAAEEQRGECSLM